MGNRAFYISQREREAHLKAAKAAGFNHVEFVCEPNGTNRFFATVIASDNQNSTKNEWDKVFDEN